MRDEVIYQLGAAANAISDQISLCIYFLLVVEPFTFPVIWSESCKTWKHVFYSLFLGPI